MIRYGFYNRKTKALISLRGKKIDLFRSKKEATDLLRMDRSNLESELSNYNKWNKSNSALFGTKAQLHPTKALENRVAYLKRITVKKVRLTIV